MREIQLTKGFVAQVSDEDYERINAFNWFASVGDHQVRAARMKNRQMIYMQHEVLQVKSCKEWEVDHRDNDTLNNQRDNLRVVTHKANMQNTERHLKRKGYGWNSRAKSYCVYLDMPNQKRKYLGYAKTEAEAIARAKAAREACEL